MTAANLHGWQIVPDGTVPFGFVAGPAPLGTGSLHFGPLSGATGANKFVMFAPYNGLASDLTEFSYEFDIDAPPAADVPAKQFSVNVYVDDNSNGLGIFGPGPGSSGFYDCGYDSVPLLGNVGDRVTYAFTQTSAWTNVANRIGTCPPTLANVPAGSTIVPIALNGGDSSVANAGLQGRWDNVVIKTPTKTTIYDFEPNP